MIDRDALHAALREFYTGKCNTGTSHVPTTCVRKAIEAYLAAAPLPGAGEPVAWRTGWHDGFWRYSDEKDHVGFIREDGGIVEPLYTAAPDTAQAVAAEREACAKVAPASEELCSDCPPTGYPTDETRCAPCPRRTTEPETKSDE